jgi:predicted RNA-binding Zn ribbon-like protein
MAQPGRLQVLVRSPLGQQRADPNQVLMQRAAGMGEPSRAAIEQEFQYLRRTVLNAHVTSYTRDVNASAIGINEPSAGDLRFIFRSGRLCLAFCATVRERWRRGFERLRTPDDLARWYAEAAVAGTRVPISGAELDHARVVREAIYRSAKALIAGGAPAAGDEAIINRAAAAPPPVPRLEAGAVTLNPARPDPAASALSAVARDAIDLLAGPRASRLRECASPECGLLFVDVSRPGRRRWCSSNACGGQARAAAYRQRRAR